MLQTMKPEEIDKYVQDIMGKMMPGNMQGMMNPQDMMSHFQSPLSTGTPQSQDALHSTTFETHDFVFVRIPIKDEDWLKQMVIYHTSNKLLLEHIPQHEDKHSITLPAIVRKKGAAANYRDGILEVRIPKNFDMQFSQIDVTEN